MKKIIWMIMLLLVSVTDARADGMPYAPEMPQAASQPRPAQDNFRAGDFVPDEVWVTPYCGVYHFDRNKIRNGRDLNERPTCLGGKLGWDLGDDWTAGALVNSFRNSIYKRTVLAGVYAEKDLLEKNAVVDACGVGAAVGGQLVRGYDAPVLGNVYGYCEKWRLRGNVTVVPPLGSEIDSAVIWTVDFKLWEG